MKDENIPITPLNLFNELKSGYTGGHTDLYLPSNKGGKPVIVYDVNSLYPPRLPSPYLP